MSELSPDARDLVAQARRQGSELLGPSAEQRAQLREKLAPLWAAEVVQPRAASGLRWKLGSLVIAAGLGMLGWLYTQATSAPPLSAASSQRSQAMIEQSASATPADDAAGSAVTNRAGVFGHVGNGQPTQTTSLASAREATEPCPRGSSLREGVCTQVDALPAARIQPLPAAVSRKAKRALTSTSAASRRPAPQPSAATAPPVREPSPAAPANDAKQTREEDLLSGLGLDADADDTTKNGRLQPTGKDAAVRLPLKAAEERTPERAVQTDADPRPPSIDGELELLGAAQTALQKQRPSRALTLLQEHAFRFPTGAMVEERMAMQALALCALQRRHAAQTVLSNLEARGSQSQLLPRVRSQCGL